MKYQKPIMVFQSDFTYKEGAVSSMYGVVKEVDRELEIFDGTHEIPRYDIWSASYRLFQTVRFWPRGTVFVSVVDPGVGTERRACAAKTKDGYYIFTPDNGTLTHIGLSSGIEQVREIDMNVNRLTGKGTEGTAVFHGRDVFGYCAAKFASGIIPFEGVGASYPTDEIVAFDVSEASIKDGEITGAIDISDPNFGNLWTNIPFELFLKAGFEFGNLLTVSILGKDRALKKKMPLVKTFGDVKKGEPIIYVNELMNMALAVSQGSFADEYGIGHGPEWEVVIGL